MANENEKRDGKIIFRVREKNSRTATAKKSFPKCKFSIVININLMVFSEKGLICFRGKL